ncbi:Uncharacterised protein [Sphingobacterium daejeonense]|nr:Uncharacterised protein [Sphingobacterium daejeonense]
MKKILTIEFFSGNQNSMKLLIPKKDQIVRTQLIGFLKKSKALDPIPYEEIRCKVVDLIYFFAEFLSNFGKLTS